jgi:hypothetical protein
VYEEDVEATGTYLPFTHTHTVKEEAKQEAKGKKITHKVLLVWRLEFCFPFTHVVFSVTHRLIIILCHPSLSPTPPSIKRKRATTFPFLLTK